MSPAMDERAARRRYHWASNVALARSVLEGRESGARRDIVLLNGAAALVAADHAVDLREGLAVARASLESGKARARLEQMIATSNR